MSHNKPAHYLDPKVVALQSVIKARDPFCTGVCTIRDYQRFLHYNDGDLIRTAYDLDMLYHACQPAEFGCSGKNVLDESYRKAGKMDLESFSTLFDPHSLGIHEQVSRALLADEKGMINMELYKLNIYGKGDFFKVHKDTPRGESMFGSLVVVLPTPHEGGQLVLRQDGKEWTIDFTDKFANSEHPSVCYAAFYSDIEHEVLPVLSGFRVTLTYNLYYVPAESTTRSIPPPQYLKLKQSLVDLVNDKSILPNGGYLGFGLAHEYVHTGHNILKAVSDQLKGSDRVLADVCDALKLPYALRLLYRNLFDDTCSEFYRYKGLHLISTKELDVPGEGWHWEDEEMEQVAEALKGLTIEEVEVVKLVGDPNAFDPFIFLAKSITPKYCRNPPTEVMEITEMKSSVGSTTTFMIYGNNAELEHFYGTACMIVAVEPATSRKPLLV